MTPPLHPLTIAEAGRRIADGSLSPVDLVDTVFARIEALEPELHAYATPMVESARTAARQAAEDIAGGRYRGPLRGIPLAIKDIYDTAGVRTAYGSPRHLDRVPDRDATTVGRLKAAGAIVVGKATTHEFAMGGPEFDGPFPPARNPWDRTRFTGGSSSGCGAAVPAGLALGAMGSDTMGSIRIPAAYCGMAGLKPTYGLVSRAGVAPLAWSLDTCGPMAWTAEDCAIMLEALAGPDPQDPTTAKSVAFDADTLHERSVAGLRLGVVRHFHEVDEKAADTTLAALEAALRTFADLGCKVVDVRLSPLWDYGAATYVICLSEAYAFHAPALREDPRAYGPRNLEKFSLGGTIKAGAYVDALRVRASLSAEMGAALTDVDALITVGAWDVAPPIDSVSTLGSLETPSITAPFNLTGVPAASVCTGFDSNGMPLGMQIAGRAFDEATVLALAHAYEQATPWRERRPAG